MDSPIPTPTFSFVGLPSANIFLADAVALAKEVTPTVGPARTWSVGRVPRPINYDACVQLMHSVSIQETCIKAKRDATVGLGFETEEDRQKREKQKEFDEYTHEQSVGRAKGSMPAKPKKPDKPVSKVEGEDPQGGEEGEMTLSKVEKILDPLCENGFQSLLSQVGEDYENTGFGCIEVVRDEGGKIAALWHMPSSAVHVFLEGDKPNFHYEVDDHQRATLKYARMGDLEDFLRRNEAARRQEGGVTELVVIKQPTSQNMHYALPSWLSCVPWLELAQKVMQYDFDYFDNRAVPDLMVWITKGKLSDEAMTSLRNQIAETRGAGKRHRTLLANIPGMEVEVQVERLESDNREKFTDLWSTIQLQVVTTHRVPPLLAGVTLPGKMAAANELPNALVAFQTLYIGQHQRIFERSLARAFEPEGLGLTAADFKLRKITDYYDMGQMDTMSRMRQTAIEAQAEGRKLEDGLKE